MHGQFSELPDLLIEHPGLAGGASETNIKALRQLVADRKQEAQGIINVVKAEGRGPTDDEKSRLRRLDAAVHEAERAVSAEETELDKVRHSAPLNPRGGGPELHFFGPGAEPPRVILPGQDRSFRAMFGHDVDRGGFDDFRSFLAVIGRGEYHPDLRVATQLETGPEGGGYLVPTQFLADLLDMAIEDEIVRPRATVIPMTSNNAVAPGLDSKNHTQNVGGFIGHWLAEGDKGETQAMKFRAIQLVAHKLGIFASASNEFLGDAATFQSTMERGMSQSVAWYFDDAYLNGDGVGKPKGVMNDPALVVVAKESGQTAGTIVYQNLVRMFARLHPQAVRRSVWVANQTAIPQLLTMTVTGDPAGEHVPVLRERADGTMTVLTRPVLFTEKVPALGQQGDILLADFSHYVIGLRREATIQRSTHIGFDTDETMFRIVPRSAGQGKWDGPMTPKNGATLSWCVTLAARE